MNRSLLTLALLLPTPCLAQDLVGPDHTVHAEPASAGLLYGTRLTAGQDWFAASGIGSYGTDLFERVQGRWQRTLNVPGLTTAHGSRLFRAGDTIVSSGSRYTSILFQVWERVGGVWQFSTNVPRPAGFLEGPEVLAFSGDRVVLSDPSVEILGPNDGSVWIWKLEGGVWSLEQELVGEIPGHWERFGGAVLLDGDDLLIGATMNNFGPNNTGRVYAFKHDGQQFQHVATLRSPHVQVGDRFGQSLGLVGDELLVAAPGEEKLHVWDRSQGSWVWSGEIAGPDPVPHEAWAWSVSAFGSQIVVEGYPEHGVYQFSRDAGGWNLVRVLVPWDPDVGMGNSSVAIGGDFTVRSLPFDSEAPHLGGLVSVFEHSSSQVGVRFCDGADAALCPCGNPAPAEGGMGCLTPDPRGARLTMVGSSSLGAADLQAIVSDLAYDPSPHFLGASPALQAATPVGSGLKCLGAGAFRVSMGQGLGGNHGPDLLGLVGASVGETWVFQAAYRSSLWSCDPLHWTPAVAVTAEP